MGQGGESGARCSRIGVMTTRTLNFVLVAASIIPMAGAAPAEKPLVIASQGSFFVGGESKSNGASGPAAGGITVNQMYVSYQTPVNAGSHVPIAMVHGCCLSSKTWETTPDGRMGWNEYFVRKGRPVYLAEQVSRGRSGFDATKLNAVKAGTLPPSQLPNILFATHEIAWTVFRFGSQLRQDILLDGQFPIEAVDELYKQMVPDLNGLLPTPNPTWINMAALAVKLKGAMLDGPFRIRASFPRKRP